MKRIFDRVEVCLGIKEPPILPQISYKAIVQYLIDNHKSSIRYYRFVFRIGVLGLVFSIFLLILLMIKHHNFNIIFSIKASPGIIFSLITMSFGHLETEIKKKELYVKLQEIFQNHENWVDGKSLYEDYKKWTWTEYQDIFKPERP